MAAGDPGLTTVQYWGGQSVLVLVALIGAWYALRGKRVDRSTTGDQILDARQARIEEGIRAELERAQAEIARLDREAAESYTEVGKLRIENHHQWRLILRYERELHRLGVDVDALSDDGGRGH